MSVWPLEVLQAMNINRTPAVVGPGHGSSQQHTPRYHHDPSWQKGHSDKHGSNSSMAIEPNMAPGVGRDPDH